MSGSILCCSEKVNSKKHKAIAWIHKKNRPRPVQSTEFGLSDAVARRDMVICAFDVTCSPQPYPACTWRIDRKAPPYLEHIASHTMRACTDSNRFLETT